MQHVANEFWCRWRKEVLLTLQNKGIWNNQKQKRQVGDIVLLRQEVDRNQWPMVSVVNVYSDGKGNVRSVRLLLGASDKSDNSTQYLERSVNKPVVLVENHHWKSVFQKVYGCKWIYEFDSPSKSQCCASRFCCNILKGAICKGTWVNRQQVSESHGV